MSFGAFPKLHQMADILGILIRIARMGLVRRGRIAGLEVSLPRAGCGRWPAYLTVDLRDCPGTKEESIGQSGTIIS